MAAETVVEAASAERPEARERRSRRKRGLAPATEARPSEGGPTGTTENEGGSVRWAVGAECCGALGCRETEALVRVERDGETRVLCLSHARRWLR